LNVSTATEEILEVRLHQFRGVAVVVAVAGLVAGDCNGSNGKDENDGKSASNLPIER
jgi:hypothetical protein